MHPNSSPQHKKAKIFRLNAKNIFLTYPKAHESETLELIKSRILKEFPVIVYYIIACELHQDGTPHFHMVICIPNRVDYKGDSGRRCLVKLVQTHGDSGDFQTCRNINDCITYCKKDGTFIEHGIPPVENRSSGFALALQADNVDAGMEIIIAQHPRDYCLHGQQIEQNIRNRLTKQPEFIPPYPLQSFNMGAEMRNWLDNFRIKKHRYKLLVVVGPAEYGKTQWARSIGKHLFFRTNVDMASLKIIQSEKIEYIIFDDVNWDYIKYQKSVLLGMGDTTITEKYTKKMAVKVDVPSIFLCNDLPDFDAYWNDQTIVIRLTAPLF